MVVKVTSSEVKNPWNPVPPSKPPHDFAAILIPKAWPLNVVKL